MKALGVIPARYKSSRFPGKPLVQIAGKTMIERVYRRAGQASLLDELLVATDDSRIADCVRSFGGNVMMTDENCPTGTERVALVAAASPGYDIVLNVQGDEPLLEPENVDSAIRLFNTHPDADITTLVRPVRIPEEADDPNCVKVVMGEDERALYFSRGKAPWVGRAGEDWLAAEKGREAHVIHIGLYAYRVESLLKLVRWPVALCERMEGLEQLRALANGQKIYAARLEGTLSIGVDVPEDVVRVEEMLRRLGLD